jgi:APA family basic amino acid/polyamine antiporter
MTMQSSTAPADELRRGLTRTHALAIVVGGILGTGIYIRSASIAQLVGSPGWLIAVWALTGLLMLAGALTYAELAARIPRSGGEYAFLRVTLGELSAFLFGWMRLTVGIATVAALAVAATVFLADLVPLGAPWLRLANPWSPGHDLLELGPRQLVAVLFIAALAYLNARGVGKAGRFQSWVTACKALGLFALIIAIAVLGKTPAAAGAAPPLFGPAPGSAALGAAALAALAAYNGWAYVAMLGGEVQDAERNLPTALVFGVLAAVALYVGVNLAYLHVLSFADIQAGNSTAHPEASSVASRAAIAALGARAGLALPLLFMVSAVGTLHCNMLATPRVLYSMARDGLLPEALGRISPVARTPVVAIATLACIGSVLAALGNYDRLTNMTAFGTLLFYALNAFGLIWWRLRDPQAAGRASGIRRWLPPVFLAGTLWLLYALMLRGSLEISAALVLMACGLPVYLLMRRRRGGAAR